MILIDNLFANQVTNYTVVKMLVPAFMAILFLQSGLDKVFNYKDNLDYFTSHFKKSPLSNFVSLLTPVITVLEVSAGILCAIGTISLIFDNKLWAFWGLIIAALALLSLFFGQRVAKDYAGAVSIVIYFALVMIGLLILV
jgi:uncharacterized membrane protein YphA (DoxX/SURF4 family)